MAKWQGYGYLCYTVKEIQEMLPDIITSTRTASPSGTECTIQNAAESFSDASGEKDNGGDT